MKKLTILVLLAASLLSLNSCGVSNAFVFNTNQNSTQVHLSEPNYKVAGKVTGSAEVSYVLIFGGLQKKQLYAKAYADMVENANLATGPKALINVFTEEHVGGVPPFYYKRTITVSANVIEFVR